MPLNKWIWIKNEVINPNWIPPSQHQKTLILEKRVFGLSKKDKSIITEEGKKVQKTESIVVELIQISR